jgi:hypothetical protein
MGGSEGYARVDYQFAGEYFRGPGPGVNAYSPDNRVAAAVDVWNLRFGYDVRDDFTVEGFVNNVLGGDDILNRSANRGGCAINTTTGVQNPACPIFVTYNPFTTLTVQQPRSFGLRATQRF